MSGRIDVCELALYMRQRYHVAAVGYYSLKKGEMSRALYWKSCDLRNDAGRCEIRMPHLCICQTSASACPFHVVVCKLYFLGNPWSIGTGFFHNHLPVGHPCVLVLGR